MNTRNKFYFCKTKIVVDEDQQETSDSPHHISSEALPHSPGIESKTSQETTKSSAVMRLLYSRTIPLTLGAMLAATVALHQLSETKHTENALQQNREAAELHDYANEPGLASRFWHRAIVDAKRLNSRERLVADMYLRASKSERNAAARIWEQFKPSERVKRRHNADLMSQQQAYLLEAQNDLQAAEKIYYKIPDTKAERLVTLNDLHDLLDDLEDKRGPYLMDEPQPRLDESPREVQDHDLNSGLKQLDESKSDLGLAAFQRYLRRSHEPSGELTERVIEKIDKTARTDYKTLQLLVPILHELIYYAADDTEADDLHLKFDWLNYTLSAYMDPSNYHDRLNLADSTKTLHGAIIEYSRCLGLKNDPAVRAKLLVKKMEAYRADMSGLQRKQVVAHIDCLKKLLALKEETMGDNEISADYFKICLGEAYAHNQDFTKAEQCIQSVKAGPNDVCGGYERNLKLAQIYEQTGLFDRALTEYKYVHVDEKSTRQVPEWELYYKIARTNLLAGRFKAADDAIKIARDKTPSMYGRSSGSPDDRTLMMDQ